MAASATATSPTLLLVFFVMLYATSGDTMNVAEMQPLLSAFPGWATTAGGNTPEAGKLAELGTRS